MLEFKRADKDNFEFVYNCMLCLLDKPLFSVNDFRSYFIDLVNGRLGKLEVWICYVENQEIGCITANQYAIPRYLGYGVELEEVVILPQFQNKGYGRSFINFLIEHFSQDILCRKVSIKTDDHAGAGKLYNTIFDKTDMITYQQYLNKI